MSTSFDPLPQLNKRFTLNLLIQGAACHTWLTAHHLVKKELSLIHSELVPFYDKLAYSLQLAQWMSDLMLVVGLPKKFWRQVNRPDHPFYGHRFLRKHGGRLSSDSKEYTIRGAKRKGVATVPGIHYAQARMLLGRAFRFEQHHLARLENLAVMATSQIWGIDRNRLTGHITGNVAFGNLQPATTRIERILRASAAGYGGVQRVGNRFQVVARAWTWPLLTHELTKGTAELICLHGLNDLDEETYRFVTRRADKIEYEIWMMQIGGQLWRLFLAALPPSVSVADALMRVAKLDPGSLEQLMMDLVEHPLTAKATIGDFFDDAMK